ncbi:unnamed protein product [Hymenolepis diminuta]|uniref:Uncharacterized protein n=1 Tax=Hymenolepis diminuta TaxID=6216 RepID=A0A564YA26_HYMDI|nr:unnamed protein product [Hymenolepis diminuta]
MSKRVYRFPPFSITASLHIKSQSALMLWRGLTQTKKTHLSVRTPTRPVHLLSSSARCSPSLSLSLSLSLLLIGAFLNTFLVYSTLGVLLHNCCWLLLKQLRIGWRNLLAANRWLLSNSNRSIEVTSIEYFE